MWSEKAWGILPHDPWHSHHNYVITPPLNNQGICETDLAFYASRELHPAHETYPLHTEGLLRDKHENGQQ